MQKEKINMANMTQAAAKIELSTLLSDTLSQVSDDRLNDAITGAWRDAYVATPVFDDTSLTFDMTTYAYDIPSTMTTVDAIYIKRASSVFPEEISSELWEVVNGQIIFQKTAAFRIPDGFALQLRGKYKLTDTDDIPESNTVLQNYVVMLAAWIVLRQIGFTRVLAFLRNDTSVAELMNFRNMVEQDLLKYRSQLQVSYVNN